MPDSPEADLDEIESRAKQMIEDFDANVSSTEHNPVAFGLKAVEIILSMDEDKGDTEDLEKEIEGIEEVQSVQVTDVRRAIG